MIRRKKSKRRTRMKRIQGSLWLLAGVFALMPLAALAADGGAKDVDAAWLKAMRANDLDGVVACYAPDAVMWFPDAPEARGTKAIRDIYMGYFSTYTVSDVTLPNSVYQTSGDLSTGWGNFTMTLQPKKGGDPVVMKGRFIDVAKRSGGKWLYVADHASATPVPPPPAAAKP
jgi:ketosteroid isomerase-like protein